jgi:hypothetical protein
VHNGGFHQVPCVSMGVRGAATCVRVCTWNMRVKTTLGDDIVYLHVCVLIFSSYFCAVWRFPRCCACVYDCWRRARRGNMLRVCCTRMYAWIYVCMKMFVEHACPYNSCIWRCCVTWYARHVRGTWYPRCVNDGTGWWVKFLSLFCVCACFTFVNVTKK